MLYIHRRMGCSIYPGEIREDWFSKRELRDAISAVITLGRRPFREHRCSSLTKNEETCDFKRLLAHLITRGIDSGQKY